MALECYCVATQARGQRGPGGQQRQQRQQPRRCEDNPRLRDIDLCQVVKRSEDGNSRHNDYECHLKGEKRQNLINKIKMYLDDYDDRPVMKGKGKGGEEGKALGQTGFGPMIKYPGYVDYEHPYFSDPYNKMPKLATTVGQRGENPCPPIQVSNWDLCQKVGPAGAPSGGDLGSPSGDPEDGRCRCARPAGEEPRCPAAV